ncbi:MAG: hypothetical protein AAF564_08360 [Bacteroidota bacterium]
MHVQWFAHLPGVQLAPGRSSYEVIDGRVTYLYFGEWCELDPSFPESEDKFNDARPVFYIGEAELEGDLKSVLKQVGERLGRFYLALLLDARVPLIPDPQLSVHYVRVNLKAGVATYRLVGPFEREWILYGNRTDYEFDEVAFQALQVAYDLLPAQGALHEAGYFPGVEAGLETLIRTARPDAWWDQQSVHHVNDFIHCTSALENLLVLDSAEEQAPDPVAAFGQHAAALVSPTHSGVAGLAQSYAGLYRLRTNLLHGQMTMADLSSGDQQALRLGRMLLREVLLKALALNVGRSGSETLAGLLKRAYEDGTYHEILHEQLRQAEVMA